MKVRRRQTAGKSVAAQLSLSSKYLRLLPNLIQPLSFLYTRASFLIWVHYARGGTFNQLNSLTEAWEENMSTQLDRRNAIRIAAALATGVALTVKSGKAQAVAPFSGEVETRKCVSPIDDLNCQHGVLRRIVNVYAETELRIRAGERDIDAAAIGDAAKLFRAFGEDWHERALEEDYIFPGVRESGGRSARLIDVLISQHWRGRVITDYLIGAGALAACRT